MIVRIATEGQYELDADAATRLRALDDVAVAACEARDHARFHVAFEDLLNHVRTAGTELDSDELVGSDVILPPPDVSFEEATAEFTGEGLLPNV